jgi:hypothetical protein
MITLKGTTGEVREKIYMATTTSTGHQSKTGRFCANRAGYNNRKDCHHSRTDYDAENGLAQPV